MFSCVRLSLCCLVLSALGGCSPSPPVGTLHGVVTFEGKPVTNATVQLQSPTTGTAVTTAVNEKGEYTFSEPIPAGEYHLMVLPIFEEIPAGEEKPGSKRPERQDIPVKYRTMGPESIKVTVVEGDNSYDVKLVP